MVGHLRFRDGRICTADGGGDVRRIETRFSFSIFFFGPCDTRNPRTRPNVSRVSQAQAPPDSSLVAGDAFLAGNEAAILEALAKGL